MLRSSTSWASSSPQARRRRAGRSGSYASGRTGPRQRAGSPSGGRARRARKACAPSSRSARRAGTPEERGITPDHRGTLHSRMSWSMFLEGAPPAGHAVQVYSELDELAASVGTYLDAGFRAGEPAVVIATAGHTPAFLAELERRGHDVDELQ